MGEWGAKPPTKTGGLGGRSFWHKKHWICVSPESITNVKYKIDHNSKTKNRTKKLMNSKIRFTTLRIFWDIFFLPFLVGKNTWKFWTKSIVTQKLDIAKMGKRKKEHKKKITHWSRNPEMPIKVWNHYFKIIFYKLLCIFFIRIKILWMNVWLTIFFSHL